MPPTVREPRHLVRLPPASLELVDDGYSPLWRWSAHHAGAPLPLSAQRQTGLAYAYQAAIDAAERLNQAAGEMRAASAWAAAVEATWWLASIEEALRDIFRPAGFLATKMPYLGEPWGRERWDRYRELRRSDELGQAMDGLLWLRHRHAHEMAMTGRGSARPAFGAWHGGVLYISAGYTWRPRSDVPHDETADEQTHLREHYDRHVAHRPLGDPISFVLQWLDRLFGAMGFAFLHHDAPWEDPRDLGERDPAGPEPFVP